MQLAFPSRTLTTMRLGRVSSGPLGLPGSMLVVACALVPSFASLPGNLGAMNENVTFMGGLHSRRIAGAWAGLCFGDAVASAVALPWV